MLELMFTLAVIVVLLAVVDPSYQYITNSNRVASEVNGLLGDLQFARTEAIKEGQTISICVSTDGSGCSSGNTNWHKGWIVFSDPSNLGDTASGGTGYTVLRVQRPFTGTDTFTASNSVSAVSFSREGFAPGIATGTLFTLHTAPSNSKWTRCLSLTLAGLMTSLTYGNAADGATCT